MCFEAGYFIFRKSFRIDLNNQTFSIETQGTVKYHR